MGRGGTYDLYRILRKNLKASLVDLMNDEHVRHFNSEYPDKYKDNHHLIENKLTEAYLSRNCQMNHMIELWCFLKRGAYNYYYAFDALDASPDEE